MQDPRSDPRRRPAPDQPSWDDVLVSYGMVAAIPILLWMVSNPLAGAITTVAIVGGYVGGRKATALVRCFYECRRLAFDVGGKARITITRPPIDEAC